MSKNQLLDGYPSRLHYVAQIRRTEEQLSAQPRFMIPERQVAAVADRIRNGDIIAATSSLHGLDIAHTGFALWIDGRLHLMHAPWLAIPWRSASGPWPIGCSGSGTRTG